MPTDIVIRKATEQNAKDVTIVLSLAFDEFKEKYTKEAYDATVITLDQAVERMNSGIVLIALVNDITVATISGYISDAVLKIQGMAVIPDQRAKGLGLALLEEIEHYARNNNCQALQLSSTPYLKRAINLYEKFGFLIVNEGPYDLFGTPLFTMRKIF